MWEIGRVVISQITFLLANRSWQQIYLKCKYLNAYLQAQLPSFFCSWLDSFRSYKYLLRKQMSMLGFGEQFKNPCPPTGFIIITSRCIECAYVQVFPCIFSIRQYTWIWNKVHCFVTHKNIAVSKKDNTCL